VIFLAAFVGPLLRVAGHSIPKNDEGGSVLAHIQFVFWLPYFAIFYGLATLIRSFGGVKVLGEALKEIEPGVNEALRASGLRQYKIVTGFKFKHKHTPPPLEGTACQFAPLWMWIDLVQADAELGVAKGHPESPAKAFEVPKSTDPDDKPPVAKSSWAESLSGQDGDACGSTFASSDNTFGSSDATFAPTKFG